MKKTMHIDLVLWLFISLSGAFSVLFGAWLAHGGQALASESLFRLQQAHHYQFLHTLALLVVAVAYRATTQKLWLIPALGFMLGIMLFSGSLYVKTLFAIDSASKFAPFGGLTLAVAWLSLLVPLVKLKESRVGK